MASKGKTVEGTDGSDFMFRERVQDHHRDGAEKKKTLVASLIFLWSFYAIILSLSLYVYIREDRLLYHMPMYAMVGLPFLVKKSVKKNTASLLMVFSTLAGSTAAYLLAVPIGRHCTALAEGPFSALTAASLAVQLFGMGAHLYSVYHARGLLSIWEAAPKAQKKR